MRRIPPRIFTDEEISLVENGVRKYSDLKDFKVDVKKNAIVVFLPDQEPGFVDAIVSRFALPAGLNLEKELKRITTYSPMMRFVLEDEENREFVIERWCFMGSIDDWIFVDSSKDLAKLVRKYCKHLGKDSFYELPPL